MAALLSMIFACQSPSLKDSIDSSFKVVAERYDSLLVTATDLKRYPHSFTPAGEIFYFGIDEWTGGFWPGALWYMYEYTGDANGKMRRSNGRPHWNPTSIIPGTTILVS